MLLYILENESFVQGKMQLSVTWLTTVFLPVPSSVPTEMVYKLLDIARTYRYMSMVLWCFQKYFKNHYNSELQNWLQINKISILFIFSWKVATPIMATWLNICTAPIFLWIFFISSGLHCTCSPTDSSIHWSYNTCYALAMWAISFKQNHITYNFCCNQILLMA